MALVVGVLTILASCQKEGDDNSPKSEVANGFECPLGTLLPMSTDTTAVGVHLSKGGFATRESAVYLLDDSWKFQKYKTVKIRNIKGTLCQEWFLEDLHTGWFTHSNQPGDEDGIVHGYYYPWEGTLNDVGTSDWNDLIFRYPDEESEHETGFHIPNSTDIDNLRRIVGDNAVLQDEKLLSILNDGTYSLKFHQWDTHTGAFWLNPCDPMIWSQFPCSMDPNKAEGCGVVMMYFLNDALHGDKLWRCYTTIQDLRCNVRLMRTISKSQWK